MLHAVQVFEFEHGINLFSVLTLKVDDGSLGMQGVGRRPLVGTVDENAQENDAPGEYQVAR